MPVGAHIIKIIYTRIKICFLFLAPLFFFDFFVFYVMAWIENFGLVCDRYNNTQRNIMDHVKKCLDVYKSIQSGLGE